MTDMERKTFCAALSRYGAQAQITMVFEEMAELQDVLCKFLRGRVDGDTLANIAEEIADVGIMLDQMAIEFEVEDAGLEPLEVSAIVKDWSDLCTVIGECGGIDRLREFAEADKDGRVVVLPCKVGDTVWAASGKIIKCEIDEMYLCDSGGIEFLVSFNCDGADCKRCPFNNWTQDCSGERYCDCEYGNGSFKDSDIGKTIFLTREEAEKALEAVKDG